MKLFKNLYDYRELLKSNIKKEIRGRYKGSWLGIIWSFLNPLLTLMIFSIVFPVILRVDVPNYTLFLFTAMIPWNFFTMTITSASSSILSNAGILKKVYFPREIIPISVVVSNLVNFGISCIILLLFLIFSGVGLSVYALLFPVVLLVQLLLLLGIGFIVSAITVYARDIEHIVNVIVLALFYATPIVYTMNMLPEKYQSIIRLNPMTSIIEFYRDILFYQKLPNFVTLLYVFVGSIVLFFVGLMIFRKLEKNFAEEL